MADLFLDIWYCNAHTTASDALWAGLPVITSPCDTFASRVCASLLKTIGLPELIVPTLQDYRKLALHYVRSPAKLRALKQRLAKQRQGSPLFDTDAFTRYLEKVLTSTWENRQRN